MSDHDLEVVDELPPDHSHVLRTPLESQLSRILHDPERHAPKWGRIAKYTSKDHGAVANSTVNNLRQRHGDDESVEGWRFERRRVDNGEATAVFAQYNGAAIIPGKKEANEKRYAALVERRKEAIERRELEKLAKSTQTAKTKAVAK